MSTTLYETAAALAVTAENLADAIDDQRPGWPDLAAEARSLLDALAPAPPGTPAALDVDAITARASAAPGGYWVAFSGSTWIPWHAHDDDDRIGPWDTGRYIGVYDGDWHGTGQPPAALWEFLAAARADVLALAAEIGRLRAALAQVQDNGTAEWACRQCSAAYFGTPPGDWLCPSCQPYGACQPAATPLMPGKTTG
jgi:rubrerythrin